MVSKVETLFDFAMTFLGAAEVQGPENNPLVVAIIQETMPWADSEEPAWCGCFVAFCIRHFYPDWKKDGLLPKNAAGARQYMLVGRETWPCAAGDLIIFKRDASGPDSSVINALGHVGICSGKFEAGSVSGNPLRIQAISGNKGNKVSLDWYDTDLVLSVRRLGE